MFHHVEYPERIVHISDEDFFAALDLGVAGMEAVGSEIKAGKADAAFQSLWRHFLDRDAPVNPFVSDRDALADQFISNRDLADTILNGGTWQFGQVVIDFSKPIAFDADFGDQSKYGFHYLNWLECVPHAALETGNADYIAKYLEIIRHWWTIRDKVTGARPMSPVFYELGLGGRSKRFIDFMYCLKALDLGHLRVLLGLDVPDHPFHELAISYVGGRLLHVGDQIEGQGAGVVAVPDAGVGRGLVGFAARYADLHLASALHASCARQFALALTTRCSGRLCRFCI